MRKVTETKNIGKINIKLKELMDKYGITIYQMSKLTDLRHQTVKAYYENQPLSRLDTEILAKFCYVLDCNVEDIIYYKQ